MPRSIRILSALVAFAAIAGAQQPSNSTTTKSDSAKVAAPAPAPAPSLFRSIEVQRLRPADQRGLNKFESPKDDGVAFNGFQLHIGGAFLQSFQGLSHENKAAAKVVKNAVAKSITVRGVPRLACWQVCQSTCLHGAHLPPRRWRCGRPKY